MTDRTPGPWTTRISPEQDDTIQIVGNIKDGILDPVAELVEYEDSAIDAANAQFIVRACNSHDQLLEALIDLAYQVDRLKGEESQVLDTNQAKKAIVAAG